MSKWIGVGYPFTKGLLGYPNIKTNVELIKDSILQILLTRKGERFFNRDFGSDLHKLVFEPNDEILKDLIDIEVREALEKYEPRIDVVRVDTYRENEKVYIEVSFKVKETGQIDSISFSI